MQQAELAIRTISAVALLIVASVFAPQPTAAQAPMVFDFEPTEEELGQTPPALPSPAPEPKKKARSAKNKPAAKGGVVAEPIAPALAVALPEPATERSPAAAASKPKRAKPAGKAPASAVESEAAADAEATKAPRPKSNAKAATKPNPKLAAKRKGGRQPTPAYQKLRESWHAPVDPGLVPTLEVTGRVPLVLSQVNGGLIETLVPQREDGGFSDADLQRAAKVFAPRDMPRSHPIAPRLLDLMYRAMRHFQVPMVHVVSGYRKDRAGSRHTQGRAVDMVLPGVQNDALAEYVRSFGYCGVGIYTNSGFVHLDVREKSYFWLDHSLPGERSRITPILPDEAIESDRNAAARGEAPDAYVPNNDKEDRAASKAYARRAKLRRERAQRQLASAQARAVGGAPPAAKPGKAQQGMVEASMFGGLPP
jgi:hypothetical protein